MLIGTPNLAENAVGGQDDRNPAHVVGAMFVLQHCTQSPPIKILEKKLKEHLPPTTFNYRTPDEAEVDVT